MKEMYLVGDSILIENYDDAQRLANAHNLTCNSYKVIETKPIIVEARKIRLDRFDKKRTSSPKKTWMSNIWTKCTDVKFKTGYVIVACTLEEFKNYEKILKRIFDWWNAKEKGIGYFMHSKESIKELEDRVRNLFFRDKVIDDIERELTIDRTEEQQC